LNLPRDYSPAGCGAAPVIMGDGKRCRVQFRVAIARLWSRGSAGWIRTRSSRSSSSTLHIRWSLLARCRT